MQIVRLETRSRNTPLYSARSTDKHWNCPISSVHSTVAWRCKHEFNAKSTLHFLPAQLHRVITSGCAETICIFPAILLLEGKSSCEIRHQSSPFILSWSPCTVRGGRGNQEQINLLSWVPSRRWRLLLKHWYTSNSCSLFFHVQTAYNTDSKTLVWTVPPVLWSP